MNDKGQEQTPALSRAVRNRAWLRLLATGTQPTAAVRIAFDIIRKIAAG